MKEYFHEENDLGLLLRMAWRLALLLAGYQLARLAFFAINRQHFVSEPGIVRSFLHGIRFDLSAIAMVNAIYCLALLCGLEKYGPRVLRWLYVFTNTVFLLLNFGDAEYFLFSGSRLTLNSFAIAQDMGQQAGQLLVYYWPILIVAFLCCFGLYKLHGNADLFAKAAQKRRKLDIALRIVALVLLVVAARGGIQAKPLAIGHAYLYSSAKHLPLTLNSTFTILKSYGSNDLEKLSYYPSWTELTKELITDAKVEPQYEAPTNVVILILESFGREYMGYKQEWEGYTPFLDELAAKSVFFETAFTNGRRSIDALPSILAGIPSLMVAPFATSPYQTSAITGLPAILRNEGYETAFFHGGHDGTMFFDILAARLGFNKYFGASAFPDQSQDDGRWGIYDEPFLKWTAQQMSQFKQPFFATIFTLTSHHPYKIPDQYMETFTEGALPIHRSIRYADYALQQFFAMAGQQPWYQNTLFVITADHTSKSERPAFDRNIGQFRSPLLFYHPGKNPSFTETARLPQHVDIMPTLISLLGIDPPPHARFGLSLLNKEVSRPVVLFNHPYYWLVADPFVLQTTTQLQEFAIYNWREDPGLTQEITDFSESEKKAWQEQLTRTLQYYRNGLIENHLNW